MHVENKVLELINEYNSYNNHRKVIPMKDFGKPFLQDTARYFVKYKLSSKGEKIIGFKQREEWFYAYGDGAIPLNIDQAIEILERQLSEIPLQD